MRESIGLGNDYKFGVEIEFTDLNLYRLYKYLKFDEFPVLFSLKHKNKNHKFDKWILDIDSSVTISDGERMIGGELSSRILTDDKTSWDEIRDVCSEILSLGGNVSSKCGLHVTVDVKKYLKNPVFLETLVKLFFVHEDSINLFFMGDQYLVRDTKNNFAYNFRDRVKNVILDDDLLKLHDTFKMYPKLYCLSKRCGLNLDKSFEKGLIEVRYGNGTLDHNIIQNFCNFVLKVIYAIESNKIDLDYLNFEIKCIKNRQLIDLTDEDIDKFIELIKTISINDEDFDSLSKQYIKVLDSKRKKV